MKNLKQAQAGLAALRADEPKLEALLQERTDALENARHDGADFGALTDLQTLRVSAQSALAQHRTDITAAEAQVNALQSEHDRQTAETRLEAARKEHDVLMGQHREAVRALLTSIPKILGDVKALEAEIDGERRKIKGLGVTLGIYRQNAFGEAVGTGFSNLTLSRVPWLFDDTFPELKSDRPTLELLEQVAQRDVMLKSDLTRHALAEAQAIRQAEAAQEAAKRQAEARALIEERQARREQLIGRG